VTDTEALSAHLVLASRFENIEVAERALHDLCATAGCDGDQLYWVVTALRERVRALERATGVQGAEPKE